MKEQINNFLLIFISVSVITCISGYGGIIEWSSSSRVLYGQDGETLLPRSSDPTEAGFIQLLFLGQTGTYDYADHVLAEIGGDGTFENDKVIAQSWVGERGSPFFPDGTFTAGMRPDSDPYTSGADSFAIRVFDTPSPDTFTTPAPGEEWDENEWEAWEPARIPTSGYYNYVVFENPVKDPADDRYTLGITTDLYTNIPVPEPSSLALIGLATLTLMIRRRRR